METFEIARARVDAIIADRPTLGEAIAGGVEAIRHGIGDRAASAILARRYDEEERLVIDWARTVFETEPPEGAIQGLFFGFFERPGRWPWQGPRTQLYVSGSEEFDPSDETGDWACSPAWFPDRRYAPSKVLGLLTKYERSGDPPWITEVLAACYASCLSLLICDRLPKDLLLGDQPWRAIATGHDSGDIYTLGFVTREGLRGPEWRP